MRRRIWRKGKGGMWRWGERGARAESRYVSGLSGEYEQDSVKLRVTP
jgi:hypothetical protein